MKLSTTRMEKIERTGIRKVFDKARELEKQGRRVIHFEIGRPDFDTPSGIKREAIQSLHDGHVHYTSNYGTARLKQAIAKKMAEDNHMIVDPEREIIVTAGAVEGLAISMLALLDEGDEVLVLSPAFTSYVNQVRHPGALPVSVPLRPNEAYQPLLSDLEERVSERTRMILINTPHNPTGAVFSEKTLEMLAWFSKEHDLLVVSDECYEDILFDCEHISIASLPGMKERTITINSTSKTFSMTGWRVGFVIASQEIMDYLIRIHQDLVICACSFAQDGAAYAYENRSTFIPPMVDSFRARRRLVMDYLKEMEGLEFVPPQGSFYFFPSIERLEISDWDFCNYLLDRAGVAVVPGESFGEFGRGHFRLAYSCSLEDLEIGLKAMRDAIKEF